MLDSCTKREIEGQNKKVQDGIGLFSEKTTWTSTLKIQNPTDNVVLITRVLSQSQNAAMRVDLVAYVGEKFY